MSTMDRYHELMPVAYAPVLGQQGSKMKAGNTFTFTFRYTLQRPDWFTVLKHAAKDVYGFSGLLTTQKQKVALTERIRLMQLHLQNDKTSRWHTWKLGDRQIGANGSKNAYIGAMWMLANTSYDSVMKRPIT